MTINKNEYLICPCRVASIPYWKAKTITVPDDMSIVHQDDLNEIKYQNCIDEPYFRLIHLLQDLSEQKLPQGYSLCNATLNEFVTHINSCYNSIGVTESYLQNYKTHPVYDSTLWLAVKYDITGEIVATGIAELDQDLKEGILEWVQVSEKHRGNGLGKYIVLELLWRMKDKAKFVTVSGQCNNPTNPERLYRKSGFTGTDVWHILKR